MSDDRYHGFVFGPADLSEDVEVDLERRKEIVFLDAHLARWTHWEVLGIPWNAPCAAAKAAYLAKVKVFHPDRYAGKRLGSFRGRLERVFHRITEARDALADEAKRAAYAKATAAPQVLAQMEARKIEDERRSEERRARLARLNPLLTRAARVNELLQRGRSALAEGRYAQAANDLQLAMGMDPKNGDIATLAADARKKAAVAKAGELLRKGLEGEAIGNASSALAAYREAFETDPGNARAAAHAARAAAQLGDLGAARAFAQGALKASPRSGVAHEALGIVLELEGNKKEARKALERALELDPQLEAAKERLKKLRWGFRG